MQEIIFEFLRVSVGVACGTIGLYFAAITLRALNSDRDAYHTNKRSGKYSVPYALSGMISAKTLSSERFSHGLAMDLDTGEFKRQARLNTEAVDDVIGRRV